MSNDFERAMVVCMNKHFTEKRMKGFAYRLKQNRFNSQYVDVIVDSLNPEYYLAIECKSIKSKRLSFSSNFHKDKHGMHQIDNISAFLKYTGRRGYLAVEFRGLGNKNEAYLMPWSTLLEFYDTETSISVDEFRKHICLDRNTAGYRLSSLSSSVTIKSQDDE